MDSFTALEKIENTARYICFVMSRMELYEDIRQDLCEDWLKGVRPGSGLMKKRAISHILSKKYNRQYIGEKKVQYSFSDSYDLVQTVGQDLEQSIWASQMLSLLTERRRQFLKLWLMGYTQSEIAEVHGVCRTNVCHLIRSSLKQLRKYGGKS